MRSLKVAVNTFVTCIILVEGMANQCTTGPNIVLPCIDMTTPTNQMFIPVNGSILTDGYNGCICDVTVVELPENSTSTEVSVRINDNNISCGFQAMTNRSIIECQNRSSSSTNIRLKQSLSLTFTRDNTPSPSSTAGFCLQVITQHANENVTKICRNIAVITNKPDTTAKPMATTRQTILETLHTTSLQHSTKTSSSTTEAPDTTTAVLKNLMTNKSTTEIPQLRESTVKAMPIITGDTSTASFLSNESTAPVNNGETTDQLPVASIGGAIGGGFLLIIIIIIVIICVCKRRKTNDYDKPSRNGEDNPYHTNITTEHNTVIHENGGHNEGQQSV